VHDFKATLIKFHEDYTVNPNALMHIQFTKYDWESTFINIFSVYAVYLADIPLHKNAFSIVSSPFFEFKISKG